MELQKIRAIRFGLRACFGDQDKIFAEHPNDRERAEIIRKYAKVNKIDLEWIEEMCLGYLYRWNCSEEHTKDQMSKIHDFFSSHIDSIDIYQDEELMNIWTEMR